MKILIVDDKEENRYLLEKFLQGNKFATVSASNGVEALDAAIKNQPDLIISDILMPVMDGFSLCRKLKTNKTLQNIPFIFYTATYTDPKDEEFALSLGADRFIIKPQELNVFLKIIDDTLNAHHDKTKKHKIVHASEEKMFLKEYSETLVRKMEDNMIQLQEVKNELNDKNAKLEIEIEKLKRSEETLRESEERFRMLVEQSPDGIIIHCDGVIRFANPAALNILDAKNSDHVIGKKVFEFVHPDYRDKVKKRMDKSLHTGKAASELVEKFITVDGEIIDVEVNGGPILFENRPSIQVIFKDITERKRTEDALKISEEKFKWLFNFAPTPYHLLTPDGVIIDVNEEWCNVLGYKKEEAIGRKIFDFISESEKEESKKSFEHKIKIKKEYSEQSERTFVAKDGLLKIFIARDYFVINGRNDIVSVQTTMVDITARKYVEDALRENERRLISIYETVGDVIFQIAVEAGDRYRFVSANRSFYKMTGLTEKMVIGKLVNEVIPEPSLSLVLGKYRQAIQENSLIRWEETTIYPSGPMVGDVSIAPVFDESGQCIFLVGSVHNITDQKQVEKKLIESERLLNVSQKVSKIGSYTLDIVSGMWIGSDALNDLFGITKDDDHSIEGWLSVIHPDDQQMMSDYFLKEVLEKKSRFNKEYRIVDKNKKNVRHVHGIGELEYDKNNNPIKMIGTIQDISERKKSEELQRLYMTAFETAANGIVITSIDGSIIWVNNAFTQMTGYTLQEVWGKNPSILKSGQQSKELYQQMWKTILSGGTWKGEVVNKRKNGTLYIDEMTITPVRNENNQITNFVAIKQDVTERNRDAEKIEEQAMLLSEAHDAIILRDLDHRILFWNRGAEKMYGWKSSEVMGKDSREILYLNKNEYADQLHELFVKGNIGGEFIHRTKEKKEILVSVHLTVISNSKNNRKSILSINEDITEKKNYEKQILRSQRLDSLGTLAGGIAHDLNNVLSPILLSIVVLKKNYIDEQNLKFVSAIESSAKRGSEIVKQILLFARGVESTNSVIQAKHLIKEIVSVFKETFPKSINIINNVPNDISPISADPTHIHQMIMNLGVNARDAMPAGGTLTITAENKVVDEQYAKMNFQASLGKYVVFSIGDTGTGMDENVLNHMFEPFFTTKGIGEGTGLGLATVHSIVKSLKGFIDVKSTIGEGTTFNVYIPAADSLPIPSGHEEKIEKLQGNNELILVVDDEEAICEVTKQTLEEYHYRVLTAQDGESGLSLFTEHQNEVDLVISDMMMPVMDGNKMAIALRKMKVDLKIIASSGMIGKPQPGKENESSVNGFLSKPYNAEKLLQIVKEVLTKK